MMRMMTETMLANSAPPESETTLEVTEAVIPSPVTCTATAQVIVAAISCRSATRLVDRWMAPIWVRSPNFRAVAIRLTTSAAASS